MFKRKDIVIILCILLVAAAAYVAMHAGRQGQSLSGVVEVYADGVLFASARLDTPRTIVVDRGEGLSNTITIDESGVYMAHSSCKNQLCVQQGVVNADNWARRAMGRSIICLPNHVLVELTVDDGHPSLQDDNLPDI